MEKKASARRRRYAELTEELIRQIKRRPGPWEKPWNDGTNGEPINLYNGQPYMDLNGLILWSAMISSGYEWHRWLTARQALRMGGRVRDGERGVAICYPDRYFLKPKDPYEIPEHFYRRCQVFNIAQCQGLKPMPTAPPPSPDHFHPRAEALIAATGADIRFGGVVAAHCRPQGYIVVPPREAFFDPIQFYHTVVHELGHLTNQSSRLNRQMPGRCAWERAAREELVAELTAVFLCDVLGVPARPSSAAYLERQLAELRACKAIDIFDRGSSEVRRAARHARRAAEYLLAFERAAAMRA